MSESLHPALAAAWASAGLTVEDLDVGSDATFAADRDATLAAPSAPRLARYRADAIHPSSEDFEPGAELGRGGMGVVYAAHQPSLRREVAMKCLGQASPQQVSSLLKEAWVAGALDHPNIVPVHTLVLNDGAPALVMKRIEGISWADAIADPSRLPRARRDAWTGHLSIFFQVCNAVDFAHSRGILHLDLKPENVMVGSFGEVYLVDWGLAAGIEDHPPWLRSASSIAHVAGTPAYMAPELAAARGDEVGRSTDVYLLGATLHEALTGRPLHDAPTLLGLLTCALLSEPYDYGPDVPAELAAILHRACHVDPEERFDSVDGLRAALEEHLEHGESNHLATEALSSLRALQALPAQDDSLREAESRCRLILEQAFQRWPDNPRASSVQAQLYEAMLEKAIERGDLDAASQLAKQLLSPHPQLQEALAELRARHAAEQGRVEQLSALEGQLDVGRALKERRQLFFALGLLWLCGNLAMGYLERSGTWPIGYRELLVEGAVLVLFFGPYFFLQRGLFFQNLVNARIQRLLVLTGVATELLFVGGLLFGLPVATVLGLTPLLYAFGFAAVAAAVDGRLLVGSVFQLLAFFGIAAFPVWRFEILGLTGLLSAATTWRWPSPQAPSSTNPMG